jgi:hypothetical protein
MTRINLHRPLGNWLAGDVYPDGRLMAVMFVNAASVELLDGEWTFEKPA